MLIFGCAHIICMRIKFVDAHKIRMTRDTDFGVVGSNEISPYVPKGEMWIDRAYKKEAKWFIAMRRLELKLWKKMKYSDARKIVCKTFLKKAIKLPEFKIKAEKKRGFVIRLVRGKIVRQYLDPKFLLGGHGYVYSYIPRNEVWIDDAQDKKEMKYSLTHELYEANLMKKGMDYNSAHDFALAAEKYERRKDGAVYLDD